MFTITKEFRFEAAHMLPQHDGKCRNLHGHGYQFTVEVRGGLIESGPKTGMVMDYKDIGAVGKEIVEKFDHTYLNDILGDSTTAEFLSQWMYAYAKLKLPQLWAVTVKETESTSSRYAPLETRVMELGKKILDDAEQRLMANVFVGDPDECWPYLGAKDEDGYGYCSLRIAGVNKAHRLLMWLRGYDIEGRVVMHSCDNPPCCNPSHLKVSTHAENEEDKDRKGRRQKGEEHYAALLTDIQVIELWKDFQTRGREEGFVKRWEERLDLVGRGAVRNIIFGWTWNHITGLPKRAKEKEI
jgi:6-pyruvoyltetrahydropterin/6-carboxytetrahydropterin synthase